MVVPTPDGERSDLVLAAAAICGVDRVFTIGGAQAVGALAYGTEIDSARWTRSSARAMPTLRRPSVACSAWSASTWWPALPRSWCICDGRTNPDWVAMDLFSQAEHDEMAQAILLCPDRRVHRRGRGEHRASARRDAAQGRDCSVV